MDNNKMIGDNMYTLSIKDLNKAKEEIMNSIRTEGPLQTGYLMETVCKIIDELNEIEKTLNNSIKNAKTENVIADAMKVLVNELKEDKGPGSYYHGWQSNLAMKILDNCDNKLSAEKCNDIAIKFLDYLIEQGGSVCDCKCI